MNRSETVTMFNDMCLLAPATLLTPGIEFRAQEDGTIEATFHHAGNTIRALLSFGADGALVDFRSDDRAQTSDGKSFARYPWSTPVEAYRDYHGVKAVSKASAVWHEPSGAFTYGRFELLDIRYNVRPD
jgi:hypothetical protein